MVSRWLTRLNAGDENAEMKKTGFARQSRFSSNAAGWSLLAVLLDAGGAQAGKPVLVDGELPGQEFVDGQRVTAAGFLKGEQAAADGSNNLSLAADDPPFGSRRGQIRNR
jgi:hypothetical protein